MNKEEFLTPEVKLARKYADELHEMMRKDGFPVPDYGCNWHEAMRMILEYVKWLKTKEK